MARYFFHVINGEFLPDTEGMECADGGEVKAQAVVVAGEMIKDQGLKIWKTRRFDLFVTDEQQRTLLKLAFEAEDLTGQLSAESENESPSR